MVIFHKARHDFFVIPLNLRELEKILLPNGEKTGMIGHKELETFPVTLPETFPPSGTNLLGGNEDDKEALCAGIGSQHGHDHAACWLHQQAQRRKHQPARRNQVRHRGDQEARG
jgi:hypothetical protein